MTVPTVSVVVTSYNYGRYIGETLEAVRDQTFTDCDVVVVDENPAAFKRLGNRFGGQVEVGTGVDYDVLPVKRVDGRSL